MTRLILAVVALVGGMDAKAAQAQTAAELNRLNQAVQVCASAAGALIPECKALTGAAPRASSSPQPRQDYYNDSAAAIAQAGGDYRACAAANPNNWQACLGLLNGAGAQPSGGAPAAGKPQAPVDPLSNLFGGR